MISLHYVCVYVASMLTLILLFLLNTWIYSRHFHGKLNSPRHVMCTSVLSDHYSSYLYSSLFFLRSNIVPIYNCSSIFRESLYDSRTCVFHRLFFYICSPRSREWGAHFSLMLNQYTLDLESSCSSLSSLLLSSLSFFIALNFQPLERLFAAHLSVICEMLLCAALICFQSFLFPHDTGAFTNCSLMPFIQLSSVQWTWKRWEGHHFERSNNSLK